MDKLTATAVNRLKLEAKELKKSANIKQTAALAQIAHREGYSSWESLMASAAPAAGPHQCSTSNTAERSRRAAQYGGPQ